ncbi:terminase [Listeria booriae]|uniref:terminase small subunit n=1 Tax=Listeria booriae TaxID=1552123 RepID=UPI001628A9CC|nr:terminase small subunit [Listeria booriae]MBC1523742.1 terminase [Listeria booriae]
MTKTEQKYKVFAQAYVSNGFNATEAAKTAGYSKNGAEARGSNLLRNDKVLAFIDEEMNMLAKRMRDDASKIYYELWKQVRMIDEKLDKHERAAKTLDELDAEQVALSESITYSKSVMRRKVIKYKSIDGRKGDDARAEKKRRLAEIQELELVIENKNDVLNDNYTAMTAAKRNLLWHKDWKEFMTLRTTILQDLFDRSGYKDVSIRNFALVDAQIAKLNAGGNQEAAIEQTIIVSNADQMKAYLDAKSAKKAGDDDGESPDSSSD